MPALHLLLVDDSPEVRTIVGHLCKRSGIRLDACPAVAPAWDFLQKETTGLVLLDVQMPPVSGIELCRLVRAAPEPLRGTPVALFTHWGVPEDVVAGLEAGADYVVSKDLLSVPAQWQRRISEIFRREGGLRQTASLPYTHELGDNPFAPPPDWTAILNLSLHHVLGRRVGDEVARIVVVRALRQVAATRPDAVQPDVPTRPPFPPDWSALVRHPDAAFLLAAALADQLECLLGADECTTIRAALAPLLVGPKDTQTLR
jgi:CheY-like chemotaxis protein